MAMRMTTLLFWVVTQAYDSARRLYLEQRRYAITKLIGRHQTFYELNERIYIATTISRKACPAYLLRVYSRWSRKNLIGFHNILLKYNLITESLLDAVACLYYSSDWQEIFIIQSFEEYGD